MKVQQGCNSADMGIPVKTEEELRKNTVITPEDVLGLQKITKSEYMLCSCPASCHVLSFRLSVSTMDSGTS